MQNEENIVAAKRLLAVLENNGQWDDGCFYYNQHSAPELEASMMALREAVKST